MAFIPFLFEQLNNIPPETFAWMTEQQNCPYFNHQRRQTTTNGCPFRNYQHSNSSNENVQEEPRNEFKVSLDVRDFKPEEITIKVVDGNVIHVEAKHEERKDELGSVSRHIVRKYNLPEGFDVNQVGSKLSTDGILSITAPKIVEVTGPVREIKVVQTGRPSNEKVVEQNGGGKNNGENSGSNE